MFRIKKLIYIQIPHSHFTSHLKSFFPSILTANTNFK